MILLLTGLTTGCLTLDTLVHTNKHCSNTGPDTSACVDADNTWDDACLSCEDPYVWDEEYPWFEGQLDPGQSVRPIDETTVVNHRLDTDDGEGVLDVWLVPGHGDNAQLTILYNHGNYIGIEHYMPRLRYFHEAGYTVIVWDYRGYGKSEPAGAPTGTQWVEDAHLVRDFADTVAPDPERIAIYANSVGGIPSVEMAVYDPGCALVLEAGFTSIESISAENNAVALPGAFLTEGHFENHEKIKDYEGPLFSMVGTEDNKFSPESITEVYDNAGTPDELKRLWVVEGVGHGISTAGIPETHLSTYLDAMDSFFDEEGAACRP